MMSRHISWGGRTLHGRNQGIHFRSAQDDRQAPGTFGTRKSIGFARFPPEDLSIEINQRVEGLILRARAHLAPNCEGLEKPPDLCRAHVLRRRAIAEENESAHPLFVALFRELCVPPAPDLGYQPNRQLPVVLPNLIQRAAAIATSNTSFARSMAMVPGFMEGSCCFPLVTRVAL